MSCVMMMAKMKVRDLEVKFSDDDFHRINNMKILWKFFLVRERYAMSVLGIEIMNCDLQSLLYLSLVEWPCEASWPSNQA